MDKARQLRTLRFSARMALAGWAVAALAVVPIYLFITNANVLDRIGFALMALFAVFLGDRLRASAHMSARALEALQHSGLEYPVTLHAERWSDAPTYYATLEHEGAKWRLPLANPPWNLEPALEQPQTMRVYCSRGQPVLLETANGYLWLNDQPRSA